MNRDQDVNRDQEGRPSETAAASAMIVKAAALRERAPDADAVARLAERAAVREAEIARLEPAFREAVLSCVRKVVAWMPPEERFAALCRRALGDLAAAERLRLEVAPEAAARVQTRLASECGLATIDVAGREGLAPDAARLITREGVVELGLEEQLAAIAAGLAAAARR